MYKNNKLNIQHNINLPIYSKYQLEVKFLKSTILKKNVLSAEFCLSESKTNIILKLKRVIIYMVFVQYQVCMELRGDRGFISKDTLDWWLSRVFVFCLFLMSHITIKIIVAKARQTQKIKKTITPNEFSESKVFVVVSIELVKLYDRPVTIILELV